MWCGKKLCEFCIAKSDGKKYYCEKCTASLSAIRRERMIVPIQKSKYNFENGYLVQREAKKWT